MPIELTLIKVLYNYILLSISPVNSNVATEDFVINRKYNLDDNYSIIKIDSLNTYKIEFTTPNGTPSPISLEDTISIYIKQNNTISNLIYICMYKTFMSNDAYFSFDTSHLSSGNYSLINSSVNDIILPEATPLTFTFCNGIQSEISKISSDKTSYILGENINLNFTLFDSDSTSVPNGVYVIKIKAEKQ